VTHRIPRLEVLHYALEGACTRRGVWSGAMDEDSAEELDKDIEELKRRIAAAEAKHARQDK